MAFLQFAMVLAGYHHEGHAQRAGKSIGDGVLNVETVLQVPNDADYKERARVNELKSVLRRMKDAHLR